MYLVSSPLPFLPPLHGLAVACKVFTRALLFKECPMRQQQQHLEACWRGRISSSTLRPTESVFPSYFDGHITVAHVYGVQCNILTHVYIVQWSNPGWLRAPDDLHSHSRVRSPHTVCCYLNKVFECLYHFWWWFLNIQRKGRHLCSLYRELFGKVWAQKQPGKLVDFKSHSLNPKALCGHSA